MQAASSLGAPSSSSGSSDKPTDPHAPGVKTMQVHIVPCLCCLCIQIRLHVVLHPCFVSTLTAGSEGVPQGICPQAAARVCGDCARVSSGF
jgi:hypothetical protein